MARTWIKFADALKQMEAAQRLRRLSPAAGVDFTSNDYLGLKSHPALRQAAIDALEGGIDLGAGGSRLLRGNHPAHEALEAYAADAFGFPAALFFSSGFLANYALLTTLPGRHDVILFDSLVHASMRDGVRASLATQTRIPHNDLSAFEAALRHPRQKDAHVWVLAESVYSMDGDVAPVAELLRLCAQYDAWLVLDEAHGSGVFGATGHGVAEGLVSERLIAVHTCGKALGVAGGLVCATREIKDYLINRARPFIYSTAPIPLAGASCAQGAGTGRRRALAPRAALGAVRAGWRALAGREAAEPDYPGDPRRGRHGAGRRGDSPRDGLRRPRHPPADGARRRFPSPPDAERTDER